MRGYYYCSLSTFFNIVKNRQIYLSDPLKMNDALELKWCLKKLNEERNSEHKSIFENMKIHAEIDFPYDEFIEILNSKGQSSIYISCFSKGEDILSQWRAYAEDGKGVSIGFNLDMLGVGDNLLIKEVIYANEEVYDRMKKDVEYVSDTISTVISEHKITSQEEQLKIFLHELIPELAKYKNPAFKEEKEVRLIYCDDMKFENVLDSRGAFLEKWEPKILEHDFRTIGNNITEFVKLDFDPDVIEHICIGPKCSLSINDVKRMVKILLGSDIEVSKSKSSYR